MENCFQNMNCFAWIKLIPVLIHLKYWCYNSLYLELPFPYRLSHFTQANLNPSSTQSSSCYSLFSLFFPTPFSKAPPQVLIQTIWNATPITYMIKLYTDHNKLWLKSWVFRAASLLKPGSTVKNNSIFSTKYAQFFTKCSFNFKTVHVHKTAPTISHKSLFLNFSQLSPPFSTFTF